MSELLYTDSDWSFPLLEKAYEEIEKIGIGEMGLNPYPNQIEIISTEQMLDAFSSNAMPVLYKHWSFGKSFARNQKMYQKGLQGLAYEIVINSNPCINYLMEENSMTMQCLVLAHAAMGHSHVFRNNATFREWTDASAIIDYLVFARDYIAKCEEREGRLEVERFLDSCHALQDYGINRIKRPGKISLEKEKKRRAEREVFAQQRVSELFDRLIKSKEEIKEEIFPPAPEENILYFCEKYAPDLKEWQREILRIVRKIAQYFYPQPQTKTLNEGAATYCHYRIMNRLHELGKIDDKSLIECLHIHTNVVTQPTFNEPGGGQMNPYALGFAMMRDIERICKEPTAEDKRWFPSFAGCGDEMGVLKDAWKNYRDESFIRQFLSPEIIRKFKFFRLKNNLKEPELHVTAIHNERGYHDIRETLASQHEPFNMYPQLEIVKVEPRSRTLYISYKVHRGRLLKNVPEMIKHFQTIWGNYPVVISDDRGSQWKS